MTDNATPQATFLVLHGHIILYSKNAKGIIGQAPNGIGWPGKSQMTTLKWIMKEVNKTIVNELAEDHTSVYVAVILGSNSNMNK